MVHNDKLRQIFDDIEVPNEVGIAIKDAINKGKKQKRLKAARAGLFSILAVIFTFTVSINTLPAFADQLDKIPGLSLFVEMVKLDKGLAGAV